MNIKWALRSMLTITIAAGAYDALATTNNAAFYNPGKNFLTKKANFASATAAADANRLYFKKVLVDTNYVTPATPATQTTIDNAISTFTLDNWKQKNGFYASGANIVSDVKYFNGIDLGLGRKMTCVNQDGNAVANRPKGMACYVSSHGKIGTTIRDGLTAANSADPSFAAVAMEYRPEDAENKVRFFVFGEGGLSGKILYPPANTTDNAFYEFDTGKYLRISGQNAPGQPVPGVCLSCHGGTLNASTGVITDAHFLPFDTFALEFSNPSDRNQSTTNSAATKFNKLNTWVYRGELSAYPYATSTTAQVQIIDFLKGSYTPAPSTTPGSELAASAVMNDDYVDTRFTAELSTDADVTRAYKSVARPYCRGCHMAQNYEISFHDLAKACDPSKNMPHSETAAINLYRHHEFVQPIINKIAEFNSSTNCKKVFKLTNFESLYPSRDGLFSYFSSNGYLVPGPSSDSTFTASTSKIAKRSLRMTQSFGSSPLYFNSLPVGTPDKGQLLGLSFEYITPMAEDSISTSIGVVDSTSTNPNIPGYPFKLATDTFSPTSMASPWMSSQRTINPGGAMLEIDNILSEWDINTTSTIQRADYEDKSSGQLGLPTMSISSPVSSCASARTSSGITNAFAISQRFKLSDDSGRYALSTNGILCTNEVAKISYTLTGPSNQTSIIGFNYETIGTTDEGRGAAQLTYVNNAGTTVTKYLHELTTDAPLDAWYVPAGGSVWVNDARANTTFTISFKAKKGTASIPSTGISIDNIFVVTN